MNVTSIRDIIRVQRKKLNLTLSQLGELSGVANGVISKLENGITQLPDFKTIQALGRVLEIEYNDMVNMYLKVEPKADLLLNILKQSITEAPSLSVDIARRFLQDGQRDSYELVDELYSFIETIEDRSIQLELYKLIIHYSRLHGIQTYFAKASLQKYLIKRDNFRKLIKTYDAGKSIIDYANFLTQEERGIFYYKLGIHAYHLNKYREAIEIFQNAENFLDDKHAELKAWRYIYSSFSYYEIGQFDIAFAYLKLAEPYKFPFVKENIQFMTSALNIKTGNTDIGIQQLQYQYGLEHSSNKINIVNILFDIYFEGKEWDTIEKLIAQEHDFLNSPSKHPTVAKEHAFYYEKTSKYYELQGHFEKHIEYLFKSLTIYAKIDMREKEHDCIESILHKHPTPEQHKKIRTLFKEFRKKYHKEVFK